MSKIRAALREARRQKHRGKSNRRGQYESLAGLTRRMLRDHLNGKRQEKQVVDPRRSAGEVEKRKQLEANPRARTPASLAGKTSAELIRMLSDKYRVTAR